MQDFMDQRTDPFYFLMSSLYFLNVHGKNYIQELTMRISIAIKEQENSNMTQHGKKDIIEPPEDWKYY